ncbi:MAG: MmcQ/YjbR family DNA-binding protein [Chloroflexota bacterium]|nr:MmcQ/YjbR family DNA-binding protein [Chloroflexota bacterium]
MLNYKTVRTYLLDKQGAVEDYPFGPDALVPKVGGKMFAVVTVESAPVYISLKCDPEYATDMRARYPAVQPGYHLSKKHWNTVTLDGTIEDEVVLGFIDDSYGLVVKSLSRAAREKLEAQ